jgi:hypothetical protein
MPKAPTWTQIKKELLGYEKSDLLEIIEKLYNSSSSAKALLLGVVDQSASLQALEAPAIKAIEKAFDPPRGYPTCKTGEARRATMEFVKAAPLKDGYEMMLLYVKSGIKCTLQYGDIDEPFYNSIESMWLSCLKTALKLPDPSSEQKRLKAVVESASGIGWGFSDQMLDYFEVDFLEILETP